MRMYFKCGRRNSLGTVIEEILGSELGRKRQNAGQENSASDGRDAIAQVLVTCATMFDTYMPRRIDGARTVITTAI